MTYDPYTSYRRPWNSFRGPPSNVKSSMSSCLYSSSPPPSHAPPSFTGRRVQRLTSSSSSSWAPDGGAERMDLAQASSQNTELLGVRSQEREQLVGLNDRFATYIEKVRRLELQNRALLAQLDALRRRHGDPSRLHALYEGEARGLRAAVDGESCEKARAEAEREHLRGVYEELKERYGEEARRRQEAEGELRRARDEAGRAALAGSDAEAGLASLAEELTFLKKVFGEEHAELQAQLQVAHVSVEVEASRPDLSSALRDIRGQYERLAQRNQQAAEDWYKGKFAGVAEAASKNTAAVHAIREETLEYRRMLQTRSAEVEGLRAVVHSLTRQMDQLEETQGSEVDKYQMRIGELETDISDAKQEMSRYLREYQDLLNVKMALDIEITAYRKLLEGEEFRLAYPALPGLA
ncbi:Neurofilament light polypeptide [Merluccius polli]|uniref:Neurofilament light polypeptide n=1 Tax=Merluccius polli TaxID=89951 RepID=A0AA47MJW7_MERPO|nr:Neurofilament light polypeptide [Merluccius polli]